MIGSYVAIGDSFTEGLGDPRPDGTLRGWADRVAEGLATSWNATDPAEHFRYANLAIRGRKLGPLLDEQLDAAIELKPDLISLNGGGNDILRPGFPAEVADSMVYQAVQRIRENNIRVLLLAGPDPSDHLPLGTLFHKRAADFTAATSAWARHLGGIVFADNFNDAELRAPEYWSEDGLHLGAAGHLRVAANCLEAMEVAVPSNWSVEDLLDDEPRDYKSRSYYREYVLPWIGRRLRGRSSGDGRSAKRPSLDDYVD